MTKLILAVFVGTFLTAHSYAVQSRQIQATAASPIPTTYSASNQKSLILSELSQRDRNIMIVAATNNRVACTISAESSQIAPTSTTLGDVGKEIYLLVSEPTYITAGAGKNIYCRCPGAACTAGELFLHTY